MPQCTPTQQNNKKYLKKKLTRLSKNSAKRENHDYKTYIKKEERIQIYNLTLYLKELKKGIRI
jgi:hypothetical protein